MSSLLPLGKGNKNNVHYCYCAGGITMEYAANGSARAQQPAEGENGGFGLRSAGCLRYFVLILSGYRRLVE